MENHNYERYVSTGGTGSVNWITNTVTGTVGHVTVYPLDGAKLLVGGEYKDFQWENEAFDLDTDGGRTTKTKDNAHIFSRGLFAEGEFRPSKYWKAIAGVRQEDHSAFGQENLPLFGVVFNPTDTMVIKASHGKHFKAPTPTTFTGLPGSIPAEIPI